MSAICWPSIWIDIVLAILFAGVVCLSVALWMSHWERTALWRIIVSNIEQENNSPSGDGHTAPINIGAISGEMEEWNGN